MRVTGDGDRQFTSSVLIASAIRGDGQTLMITLIEAEDQKTGKLFPAKIGVAIPLSNIAGWQTEMRKR